MTAIHHLKVDGIPQPQGSSSAFVNKATGRAIVTSANPKLKAWRATLKNALESAWEAQGGTKGSQEEFSLGLQFILPRPKSRKRAINHLVKPDLDKLVRAVGDAATEAKIWKDDSQVTFIQAGKRYQEQDEEPGVFVSMAERYEE